MDDNKIVVKDGDTIIIYNVLFTVEDEENNKKYVIYSDNTLDENNNIIIQASIQDPITNELLDITDPKEQEMIAKIMKSVEDSVKEARAN